MREQMDMDTRVLTKAMLRAGSNLGLTKRNLGRIIGVSAATISRMEQGSYVLNPRRKSFELALLLVRLFESLDRTVTGDQKSAISWLRSANTVLGGLPIEKIQTVSGLTDTIAYLETRLART